MSPPTALSETFFLSDLFIRFLSFIFPFFQIHLNTTTTKISRTQIESIYTHTRPNAILEREKKKQR